MPGQAHMHQIIVHKGCMNLNVCYANPDVAHENFLPAWPVATQAQEVVLSISLDAFPAGWQGVFERYASPPL